MISAALSFFGARPALARALAVLIVAVALWLAGRAWVASIQDAAFERGMSACRQARLERDLDAAGRIRHAHVQLAVEAAETAERGVDHVRPVGGRDHDDRFARLEAVH